MEKSEQAFCEVVIKSIICKKNVEKEDKLNCVKIIAFPNKIEQIVA